MINGPNIPHSQKFSKCKIIKVSHSCSLQGVTERGSQTKGGPWSGQRPKKYCDLPKFGGGNWSLTCPQGQVLVMVAQAFGVQRFIHTAVWCLGRTYFQLGNHHLRSLI